MVSTHQPKPRPNAAQGEHWNGPEGRHWVADQERYDAMLGPFGDAALEAAAIGPGDRVLDVGCGCATTTLAAAALALPGGAAFGVDLSAPMLTAARRRAKAAGVANVVFLEADAQDHPFDATSVDVVISRFGVMFFDNPVTAFVNLANALRRGGRLAFVCWQDMAANEWMLFPATAALAHVPTADPAAFGALNPFGFADADRVSAILSEAGFSEVVHHLIQRSLAFGGTTDLATAVAFFRHGSMGMALLGPADSNCREHAVEAVREAFRSRLSDTGVQLGAAAWLVTATRP
jgi:ubiquinone/menaquinone biosynthesis C-methylase UbiE